MGIKKGEITGRLVSKLTNIGTRSEGPIYFILPTGGYSKWIEIPVRKKAMPWMKDLVLHDLIGEIITIKGEIIETKNTITIEYNEVIHKGKVILPKNWKKTLSFEEAENLLKD